MENFVSIKREDGSSVSNPAERNIILLRYAAFLEQNNEQNNAAINGINIQTIAHPQHQQQQTQTIQIIEQPQPTRKSTKANVQNAQGNNLQTKVGG
jgi:hypothetical protein